MNTSFKDKVVLITGAGSGIGKEVAMTYVQSSALVLAADKDLHLVETTVEQMKLMGGKAFAYQVDVSEAAAVEQLFKTIRKDFKRLDILINNAGITCWKSPYDLLVDEWDQVMNTNLRGTFLCAREAARQMRQQKQGAIVNIASTRALMSEPNTEAYAASKGGIVALTHALAASLAADNIRVNCISPGWIETGDYELLRAEDHAQHLSGRVGKPADIAKACLYLTQTDNAFINGTNLVIDGGMTHKMIYED